MLTRRASGQCRRSNCALGAIAALDPAGRPACGYLDSRRGTADGRRAALWEQPAPEGLV